MPEILQVCRKTPSVEAVTMRSFFLFTSIPAEYDLTLAELQFFAHMELEVIGSSSTRMSQAR